MTPAERRARAISAAASVAIKDADDVYYRYPPASAEELAEADRLMGVAEACDAEVERLVPDEEARERVHAAAHAWIFGWWEDRR